MNKYFRLAIAVVLLLTALWFVVGSGDQQVANAVKDVVDTSSVSIDTLNLKQ